MQKNYLNFKKSIKYLTTITFSFVFLFSLVPNNSGFAYDKDNKDNKVSQNKYSQDNLYSNHQNTCFKSEKTYKNIKGEWILNSTGWWYKYSDGSFPFNTWKNIDGSMFHFDSNGYMQTGWIYLDNFWFYLDENGRLIKNSWIGNYYLASDGSMLTNTTTPDGYRVNESGMWIHSEWVLNSTGWWYKYSDGSFPFNTWKNIDGSMFHFDSNGYMQTGWIYLDNFWFYLDENGRLIKNSWIGNYYLASDGSMLTNTTTPDGYRVDESGNKIKGTWITVNNKYKFKKVNGCFAKDEWEDINEKWYHFDSQGYMQTRFLNLNGNLYYLNDDGSMAKDTIINDYFIDENGICKKTLKKINYYAQNDSRWSNSYFGYWNMASSGCVPTTMAMVVSTLKQNSNITPYDIAYYLWNNTDSFNKYSAGTESSGVISVLNYYDLKYDPIYSKEELITALKRGKIIYSINSGNLFNYNFFTNHATCSIGIDNSFCTTNYNPDSTIGIKKINVNYLWNTLTNASINYIDNTPIIAIYN